MKTALGPDFKSKTFCTSKSYSRLIEKQINVIDNKLYQKLFVFLVLFSTFLIIPESPREMENICESYNSRSICNVW